MVLLCGLFLAFVLTRIQQNQHSVLHQRLFAAQAELMAQVEILDAEPLLNPPLDSRGESFRLHEPFGIYARLFSKNGEPLQQTANFVDRDDFEPMIPDSPAMLEIDHDWMNAAVRSMYAPIIDGGQHFGWIETTSFAWTFRHQMPGVSLVFWILLAVVLTLSGGYLLARQALRPVGRLTNAAKRISATDLSIRLPADARIQDELTELAETFNLMLERLEAAFEMERRFTANAAHELLNPLTALRSELEINLRRDRSQDEYREILASALETTEWLGLMVSKLLELAQVESADDPPFETMDLAALTKECAKRWKEKAAERRIEFYFDLENEAWIGANPVHIRSLLDNLVENAIKYTGPAGRINVTIAASSSEVVLSIEDTGIGFNSNEAGRLFDRFYRTGSDESPDISGTGLGLAIVKAITARYRGMVTASSQGKGKGSVFTVSFPTM